MNDEDQIKQGSSQQPAANSGFVADYVSAQESNASDEANKPTDNNDAQENTQVSSETNADNPNSVEQTAPSLADAQTSPEDVNEPQGSQNNEEINGDEQELIGQDTTSTTDEAAEQPTTSAATDSPTDPTSTDVPPLPEQDLVEAPVDTTEAEAAIEEALGDLDDSVPDSAFDALNGDV